LALRHSPRFPGA
jgi:hypothetical protein